MNSPIYMINRENGKVHRAEWVNNTLNDVLKRVLAEMKHRIFTFRRTTVFKGRRRPYWPKYLSFF